MLGGGYACLRGLRPEALRDAVAAARWWPLVAGTFLNFLNMGCKAACWNTLLAPEFPVGVLRLFRYQITASAMSAVAPMRAGEAVRVWLLKARDGVPLPNVMAVAVAEKVLDALAMLLLVAPLPWLLDDLPVWVARTIALMCAGGTLVAVGMWLAARFITPAQWSPSWRAAVDILHQPLHRVASALAVLVASWFADLAAVWLVLYAVGLPLPLAAGLLILLTLNLAIAVPSTPAQIGALELGAIAALKVFGVSNEQALAFAMLYHAIQIIPLLLVALIDIRFVLGARRPRPAN